jgi:glucosylceramidase
MSALILAVVAGHITLGLAGPVDPPAKTNSLSWFRRTQLNSTIAINDTTAISTASAYCSNSDLSYALSSIPAPVQGAGSPGSESTWALTIDDTSTGYKQSITGFGAAVTDATVTSFNTLSSSTLNNLLSSLMTSSGADFSLIRHTIGASDLSGDPAYTYDDNNGNVDTSLSSFNISDRGTAMANLLASMKSKNSKLEILGSPWSPPGWMKINGVIDGSTTNNNLNDGYISQSTENHSSEFAKYFVKYIQAYEKLGAVIDAITIQNEVRLTALVTEILSVY